MLYTLYCVSHILYFVLYRRYCILNIKQYIRYTIYYVLNTVYYIHIYILYTVYYILTTVYYTLHSTYLDWVCVLGLLGATPVDNLNPIVRYTTAFFSRVWYITSYRIPSISQSFWHKPATWAKAVCLRLPFWNAPGCRVHSAPRSRFGLGPGLLWDQVWFRMGAFWGLGSGVEGYRALGFDYPWVYGSCYQCIGCSPSL